MTPPVTRLRLTDPSRYKTASDDPRPLPLQELELSALTLAEANGQIWLGTNGGGGVAIDARTGKATQSVVALHAKKVNSGTSGESNSR